jgi:hypothetical protein
MLKERAILKEGMTGHPKEFLETANSLAFSETQPIA